MNKRIALAAIGLLALAGCSSSHKAVVGTVVSERDIPAHEGKITDIIGYFPTATPIVSCSGGKTNVCTTTMIMTMQPMYGPVDHHFNEEWVIVVKDSKGKLHNVSVSHAAYDRKTTGSKFDGKLDK